MARENEANKVGREKWNKENDKRSLSVFIGEVILNDI